MNFREFWRYHSLKAIIALVAIQLVIIAVIQGYNHKPVTERDSCSVIENRTVKINPTANDQDKDDNTELNIASFEEPHHGKVEQKGNIFYYTPEDGYFGLDSFNYTITDGKKISSSAYVSVEVLENKAPEILNDTISVYNGQSGLADVLSNDFDNENDSIFISEFSQPKKGILKIDGNRFIYTSSKDATGDDYFTYSISDGKSTTKAAKVVIQTLSTTNNLYPWLSSDIGNVALKGSAAKTGNEWIIKGSGDDIWGNEDGFHYVYQLINGDCELTAKVESLEAEEEWAKAGVMVRENLSKGSKFSFMVVSNKNGAMTHQRQHQNESASGTEQHPEASAPYWIRIKRTGDLFTYSVSQNNKDWETIEEQENPLEKELFVGFVCTSHNNTKLATVRYSNIKLQTSQKAF